MKKTVQYSHAYLIQRPDHLPTDFPVKADFAKLICGLFLPSRRHGRFAVASCPARILLLFPDSVAAVPHPSTGSPRVDIRIDEIVVIEQRRLFPDASISIQASDGVQECPYDVHEEGSVGEFLSHLRHLFLTNQPAERTLGRSVFGEPLDHKFGCGESDNVDRSEALDARFFSAPTTMIRKRWLSRATVLIPGEYLALTSRRILWLSDQIDGVYQPSGMIAKYAPLRHISEIRFGRRGDTCEINLEFWGNIRWSVPIQPDFYDEAESFTKQARELLRPRGAKKWPERLPVERA